MYKLQPYNINLINSFGTNHSVTTQRKNAYLEVQYLDIIGMAEIGMPPKKENCYFTDYDDVEEFFKLFQNTPIIDNYNAFSQFENTPYFNLQEGKEFLNSQLSKLDSIPNENVYLACKSLFECALIDWYCKYTKQSIAKFISLSNFQTLSIPKMRNFYTISLLDNIEEVLSQLDNGTPYTPNIKIKVGSDLQYVSQILQGVYDKLIIKSQNYCGLLCIDCNSSWTPQIAVEFLDILNNKLQHIKPYLYMIEQPFPLKFNKEDWYSIKQAYILNKIEIFADESIKTVDDVIELQSVVTGVNVKLEKSGGYRGAVSNFLKAEQLNLKKWVGIMVGSSLLANQAINLLGLATIGGDIDGTLLVDKKDHKVQEDFIWHDQKSEFWGLITIKINQ